MLNITKFYPISRYRNILTQEYIEGCIIGGACGYNTFREADDALDKMDTDDCDYEVCFYDGSMWRATRDGVNIIKRSIP